MSVDLFMKQLDTKRTGHVNETQFVTNVLRHYPEDQLKKILSIELIPPELLDQVNMNPSVAGSHLNMKKDTMMTTKNSSFSSSNHMKIELDNQLLEEIASKAIRKDWEKLAIKLGFLEYDIKDIKSKNNGKAYDTVRSGCLFLLLFESR